MDARFRSSRWIHEKRPVQRVVAHLSQHELGDIQAALRDDPGQPTSPLPPAGAKKPLQPAWPRYSTDAA